MIIFDSGLLRFGRRIFYSLVSSAALGQIESLVRFMKEPAKLQVICHKPRGISDADGKTFSWTSRRDSQSFDMAAEI